MLKLLILDLILSFVVDNIHCGILLVSNSMTQQPIVKILGRLRNPDIHNKSAKISTFSVIGLASTNVKADLIQITINIITKEKQASNSIYQNNISTNAVLEEFNSLGISQDSISQTGFSLTQSYKNIYNNDTNNYESIFEGYQTKNSLTVNLSNLALSGRLIDRISGVNGVLIEGVTFLVKPKKQKEIEYSLIVSAIKDASSKARITLKKVNYKIKKIISFQIGRPGQTNIYAEQMAHEAGGGLVGTTFLSSNEEISIYVLIKYEVVPISNQ